MSVIKTSQGTSDSAALTTGLAAYYLKLAQAGVYDFPQTPIGPKNWIISQAWERKPGIPGIWSGVILDDNACEWTPPAPAKRGLDAIMARQAGAASSCGIPASLRSAIATDTIRQPGLTPTKTGVTSTTAPTTTTINKPSTLSTVVCKTATAVPGQCGVPGCAYVKASDVGPDALCSADYCNCGGTAAPLLTVSVTGTLATNCDYTLQPTPSSCPDETGAKTTTPPTTTAQRTTTAQPKPTPNTPLTLGSQHCNNADDFAGHGEIIPEIFDQLQAYGCVGGARYRISATYNPMIGFWEQYEGAWYYFKITWVEGCVTTVDTQLPFNPIPGNSNVTCNSLFTGDFYDCDNAGAGGSIRAGCLEFLFLPIDGKTV